MSRYCVLQWLDGGAFGEVWKVRDQKAGIIYAAKEIYFKKTYMDEECIVREKQALSHLSHEGIVKLMDFVLFPAKVWLIVEYANGGSLQDATGVHANLGDNEKVGLVKQLLRALQYLHGQNFAHMDLNPRNILLVLPLTLKLADFGQAVVCGELSKGARGYLGDRKYLSPEVLRQENFDHKPVDIWGFGCVMFYIFTMKHLFSGTTEAIVNEQKQFCQADKLCTYSDSGLHRPGLFMMRRILNYQARLRPRAEELEGLAVRTGLYS